MKSHGALTEGPVWKTLSLFFIPVFWGNLFQQLYTTVDAAIIGRFAGKEALASIDAVHTLIRAPVNFFSGLSAGAAIIISQYAGAGDHKKLSAAMHTALAFAFTGGLALSAAAALLAPLGLRLLRVPGDIYPSALSYVRICFAGFALPMTASAGAGIFRALGNSKTPFWCLIAANLANLFLDLLLVGFFRLNTAGAAAATLFSQFFSAALILAALRKSAAPAQLVLKKIGFHRGALKRIILLGLPLGIRSAIYPLANTLIQAKINSFGVTGIAAWAVCGKLDLIVWLAADSLGAAVSVFTAQNYGARRYARARRGMLVGAAMSLGLVLGIGAVLYQGSGVLGRLFVGDREVLGLSSSLMRLLAPLYGLYAGGEILSGAISGTGETFRPMLLTLAGTCAARVLWVLGAVPLRPTLEMTILAYPVSWALTSALLIVYYRLRRAGDPRQAAPFC